MKPKVIEFGADRVRVSGPRVDGSLVVSFETGEDEQEKIAELLKILQQTLLKVRVEVTRD